jgi:hypothetical protein
MADHTSIEKILINVSEYERLKNIEEKYIHLQKATLEKEGNKKVIVIGIDIDIDIGVDIVIGMSKKFICCRYVN